MSTLDTDLATAYLAGRLSADECRKVEIRLSEDPNFSSLVEDLRVLQEIAIRRELEDAKEALQIAAESSSSRIGSNRSRYLKIAASLALLATIGAIFIWQNQGQAKTPQDIFASEFTPMVNNESSAGSTALPKGFEYYDAQDWPQAIAHFGSDVIGPDHLHFDRVQVYLGVAHLGAGDAKGAITVLSKYLKERCPDTDCTVYRSDSRYYLGLAYLLDGDTKAAKEQFESMLGDSESAYSLRIKKILLLMEDLSPSGSN